MVRTWLSHSCGAGSIPGQGTKILQAVPHSKRKKEKERKKPKIPHGAQCGQKIK